MVWVIENLKDLSISIAVYISQAVESLVNALTHPFIYSVIWMENIIKIIINSIIGMLNSIWNTFDILYIFLTNLLVSLLPNAWTTIILIGVSIVFLLRLYYFIKDVSILGNKI